MIYGSVCSGIEAATVAWEPLGWRTQFLAEVEPFPSAVLQHHYPGVPNMGDMTKFKEWNDATIDVLVGGTPCQSFSVAGLRKGLDDPRGNLMLTYLAIAVKYRPKWVVWENVPGVLSSNGGRDFATFFRGLEECGYGVAYRVLDAQYFGVAQRRRRVFVVGCLGSWQRAAAVLFERDSLCGNPPPSRKAREENTGPITAGISKGMRGTEGVDSNWMIPVCVPTTCYGIPGNWIGRKPENGGNAVEPMVDIAPCQTKTDDHVVAFNSRQDPISSEELAQPIGAKDNGNGLLLSTMQVRRLTPVECERLQGFPDGYTNIPWRNKPESPDGPRYKALGNSMAVPVMRWIGERIEAVDSARV